MQTLLYSLLNISAKFRQYRSL